MNNICVIIKVGGFMEKQTNLLVLYERNDYGDYEYRGIALAYFKDNYGEIMSTSIELNEEDLLDSTYVRILDEDDYEIYKDSKLVFINHDIKEIVAALVNMKMPVELLIDLIINEYDNTVLYCRGDGLYSKIPIESYKTSVLSASAPPKQQKTNKQQIEVSTIIQEIKRKFVAQEDVVESIVSNIYINQMLVKSGDKDLISTSKSAILLDGPTGTGKTAILNEVAHKLELPIVIAKSTDYSTSGYVGDSLCDILSSLLDRANGDLKLAERGIVCMDEIDKLAGEKANELKMKKAVQHDLLAFIGGSKYNVKKGMSNIEFDTTNLTFIAMGAFTNLSDDKKEKPKEYGIKVSQSNTNQQTYEIKDKDYVNYGLERELVGRLTLKTHTNAYEVEDFKRILLESEISPLKMFIKTLKALGINDITYDDEFIELVSNKAYESGFGARGLQSIFLDIRNDLSMKIIENNLSSVHLSKDLFEKVKQKSIRRY